MQEIIEFLNSVGYHGECIQASSIENMLENGISSPNFRSLVSWLTGELSILQNLDEQIGPDSEATDFILELSSMLKELCCPYPALISGSPAQRFQSKHDCLLLLNYLISELMASKMCHKLNPQKKVVIKILESSAAIALKSITQNLNLGKPPQSITPKAFFEKLLNKFSEIFTKNDKSLYMPSRQLSVEEWKNLEKLENELNIEYDLRREMLMTRLDVTIQSFQWSDVMKNESNFIAESYSSKRQELNQILTRSKANIVELLAAQTEILHVEKTSSTTLRKNTQLGIQKHIIGSVPDRGGRTNEMQRPPPEMPGWQKNRSQGGQGGNSGGGANRGFNYKPQQQRSYQQSYQQEGSYQSSGNNFKHQKTGSGNSNYYNSNRNCANHNRVQGGWSQGSASNHNNQLRNDNYYSGGISGTASNRNSFYGQDLSSQDLNQRGERRGDGYTRGQSNYNRGRR